MVAKRKMPLELPGEPTTGKQTLLEGGAKLLQTHAPINHFDIYVAGFHCCKEDPHMQMEAHHFCRQVNQELLQCVVFDGNTREANLIGVEYIISERLFNGLPEDEKDLWHPHNYEVLSGTLIAPGLPTAAEKATLQFLVNSYGKTWHLWNTGRYDGKGTADPLPMGPAKLMWSFNRDGEADPSLERSLAEAMGVDFDQKRRERQGFVEHTHPQRGVDALKGAFPDASPTPPPGVEEG